MIFQQCSQNGIQPPTELKTLDSRFALAISTTSTYENGLLICKAISNAAMYKTIPVTFYSKHTVNGTTSTITLGTSTWSSPDVAVFQTTNLTSGTHQIYAVWPGEGRFAPQTTEYTPVQLQVLYGYEIGTPFTLTASPSVGVATGQVTFTLNNSTTTNLTSTSATLFINNVPSGTMTFVGNTATTVTSFASTGTYTIKANWNGALIGGTYYKGTSSNTLNYSVPYVYLPSTLTLTSNENPNSRHATTIFTATFNTTTTVTGNIQLKRNGQLLSTQAVSNNKATFTYTSSTLGVGTFPFQAVWPGTGIFTSTSSNIISQEIVMPTTVTLDLDIPSEFAPYTVNKQLKPAPTGTVTFYGSNPAHQPSGTVRIYDETTTQLVASLTFSSTGTQSFSLPEFTANNIGFTRGYYAKWDGDAWNYSKTSTTKYMNIIKTVATPTITVVSDSDFFVDPVRIDVNLNSAVTSPATAITLAESTSTWNFQEFPLNAVLSSTMVTQVSSTVTSMFGWYPPCYDGKLPPQYESFPGDTTPKDGVWIPPQFDSTLTSAGYAWTSTVALGSGTHIYSLTIPGDNILATSTNTVSITRNSVVPTVTSYSATPGWNINPSVTSVVYFEIPQFTSLFENNTFHNNTATVDILYIPVGPLPQSSTGVSLSMPIDLRNRSGVTYITQQVTGENPAGVVYYERVGSTYKISINSYDGPYKVSSGRGWAQIRITWNPSFVTNNYTRQANTSIPTVVYTSDVIQILHP